MTAARGQVVAFPFDLFGSGGAGAGAQLLLDELREIVADTRRETVATRATAYAEQLRFQETAFPTLTDYQGWRERGRSLARKALRDKELLVWLTGNHLGALPVYDELSALPEPPLVIQLDAHLDIHHFRDCETELTHGNFLLQVAGGVPPLVNLGHRDLLLPVEYVKRFYRQTYGAAVLASESTRCLKDIRQRIHDAKRIVVDLDCDVFDPTYFPAVGRPVPFGLSPRQILEVLEAIPGKKLSAVLVSEFDPGRDHQDRSLSAVTWLLEWMLLKKFE